MTDARPARRLAVTGTISAALVLLAGTSPLMLNCFGTFPLTRAVYKMNAAVGNGLLQTVVYWIFLIAPVYSTTLLIDAVLLNMIEFWTSGGVEVSSATDSDGRSVAIAPSDDGREAVLTISKDGQVVGHLRFVRIDGNRCEVRDEAGNVLGMAVGTASGDLRLTDGRGEVVSVIPAAELAAFRGI